MECPSFWWSSHTFHWNLVPPREILTSTQLYHAELTTLCLGTVSMNNEYVAIHNIGRYTVQLVSLSGEGGQRGREGGCCDQTRLGGSMCSQILDYGGGLVGRWVAKITGCHPLVAWERKYSIGCNTFKVSRIFKEKLTLHPLWCNCCSLTHSSVFLGVFLSFQSFAPLRENVSFQHSGQKCFLPFFTTYFFLLYFPPLLPFLSFLSSFHQACAPGGFSVNMFRLLKWNFSLYGNNAKYNNSTHIFLDIFHLGSDLVSNVHLQNDICQNIQIKNPSKCSTYRQYYTYNRIFRVITLSSGPLVFSWLPGGFSSCSCSSLKR